VAVLTSDSRKQLARVIQLARRVADTGARKALQALAVDRRDSYSSMSDLAKALRNRLRAHGHQLGDARYQDRNQAIEHLAHEVAYEHWHRMLFARFLTENHLLIEPESGVAVSMADCEELARELSEDPWALAGRFAQRMLPRIFRADDPALEVPLAPENQRTLERHLESLPTEIFVSDDALGWTYQFWQAEEKERIDDSEEKIGADELPAVTQLFTERYMVLFLFHNTIGAWHASKVLKEQSERIANSESEATLRDAMRLSARGGYDFHYLRLVREFRQGDVDGNFTGPGRPAAGAFEGWPRNASQLRILDPCCGSGHFLVEGLELLARLRMEEEDLGCEEAIRAVLADNLFGLELDPRCTQIAAFNVALTAWKLAGRPIELPQLHIASSGLAPNATKGEWLALAGNSERLLGGMERLYDLFEQAPVLGSLIDPRVLTRDSSMRDMYVAEFSDLQPILEQALEREALDDERAERAVTARGMAHAVELLADRYTLIITNVPFLARSKQGSQLREWAERHESDAKQDLATIVLSRAIRLTLHGGSVAVVTPQNWLNLTSYARLRSRLVNSCQLNLICRLGANAFREMNWWAATTALSVLTSSMLEEATLVSGIDVSEVKDQGDKARLLRTSAVTQRSQTLLAGLPDTRFAFDVEIAPRLLGEFADSLQGISTTDSPRFVTCFWESATIGDGHCRFQGSSRDHLLFGGRESVLAYDDLIREAPELGAAVRGRPAWNRLGVAVRQMRHLPATLYSGEPFDTNVAVICPKRSDLLPAIWAFCVSDGFLKSVRALDQKTNVTNATLVKVPFDVDHWERLANARYPKGLPEPESDRPSQWLFHGHPARTEPAAVLQVAVARLLGYRWPPEHDAEMRLSSKGREWVTRCQALDSLADGDGVVCLSALRGEAGAADRLRRLLSSAFEGEWSVTKERELLAAARGETTAGSLEQWLRDHFFEEHCKLFHYRPFIWHVWDSCKDGFHAFVNYHLLAGRDGLGRRTLKALTYSYLGDWIERQRAEQREEKEGAEARLAAAMRLQVQLEAILAGEPPLDIFVRWKPLHQQPVGWDPDINDGVRVNIRPFMSAELRAGSRKGAGILRWKPNIKWDKDRGKEPESLRPHKNFPWFWGCHGDGSFEERTNFMGGVQYDGNRWNQLHYSNDVKFAARERVAKDGED
jgi:hypothetical protein